MAHQTFKVCILIEECVENFYIKHYIDEINPIFNRFKNQVFNRNPSINSPNLKIYWIDAEEDKILVACEEDFRLYLEQGKGRKIFFCSKNLEQQQQQQNEDDTAELLMDSEEFDHKCDRKCKCRKGHKEDEKKRRHAKKLAEKLRHYEDSFRTEEERSSRKQGNGDKRECKSAERLERARRRVEQIRSIIGSSIDPANLNSSNNEPRNHASTSEQPSTSASMQPSPETVRLLSNAIAGCLQPCTVINKVLNEVFAMIPQLQVIPLVDESSSASTGSSSSPTNTDQQQQTMEIPKQSTATNTSDANTPVPERQTNHEIEALFKEAAKELEKMNEIVKNNKMDGSMSSSSSTTGVTQIEKVFQNITDSAISNATVINMNPSQLLIDAEKENDDDVIDGAMAQSLYEEFKILTPTHGRSRESSIEVHDVNSMMSDDSRDWTILDQDQEEISIEQLAARVADPKTGAIPKNISVAAEIPAQIDVEIQTNEEKRDSIKSISTETQTQTPSALLNGLSPQQLQESVQKSIDIVQKSIESIQKSMESANSQETAQAAAAATIVANQPIVPKPAPRVEAPKLVATTVEAPPAALQITNPFFGFGHDIYPSLQQQQEKPTAPIVVVPEVSQANSNAMAAKKTKFAPAVIVYDPNPKINSAVHTMLQMGFTNEDNWLTQLLINVDGDIPKALNFLTPQPKNKKE